MPEADRSVGRPTGGLLANLLLFGRLLRQLGLDINPGRMIDLVEALGHIDIGRERDFYHATRSLLVHDHDDIALFDRAYDSFWLRQRALMLAGRPDEAGSPDAIVVPPLVDRPRAAAAPEPPEDSSPVVEVTMTYSPRDALRHKEFAEATPDELVAIRQLIATLAWELGQRRTRRQRPGRGRAIDMRRSLRGSLRHGGEIMTWSYRRPQLRPRPLVILADISGSMERYTRLLLHFVYSLNEGLDRAVETFVFGTQLTRITRQLRGRDVDRALQEVARAVPDWSGGTRIGEAIRQFNFDWARRVLGRGAVVLLISDGWDRGDPGLMAAEIARLQRSCHRLMWLNPLLGTADYEPLTRGLQAALPFVDDFLPLHNLASLEALAGRLLDLDPRRPTRRQHRIAAIPVQETRRA